MLPVSGALWLAGFLAITGSPPFGPFLSEFTVLKAAVDQGHAVVAVLYLGFLGVIFVGMAGVFLRMSQGRSSVPPARSAGRETAMSMLPPTALGLAVLGLGIWIPAPLLDLLHRAARAIGGL